MALSISENWHSNSAIKLLKHKIFAANIFVDKVFYAHCAILCSIELLFSE